MCFGLLLVLACLLVSWLLVLVLFVFSVGYPLVRLLVSAACFGFVRLLACFGCLFWFRSLFRLLVRFSGWLFDFSVACSVACSLVCLLVCLLACMHAL